MQKLKLDHIKKNDTPTAYTVSYPFNKQPDITETTHYKYVNNSFDLIETIVIATIVTVIILLPFFMVILPLTLQYINR